MVLRARRASRNASAGFTAFCVQRNRTMAMNVPHSDTSSVWVGLVVTRKCCIALGGSDEEARLLFAAHDGLEGEVGLDAVHGETRFGEGHTVRVAAHLTHERGELPEGFVGRDRLLPPVWGVEDVR